MDDFLAREADVLGGQFSPPTNAASGGDDFDVDFAASAFPDIDVDGDFGPPEPIFVPQTQARQASFSPTSAFSQAPPISFGNEQTAAFSPAPPPMFREEEEEPEVIREWRAKQAESIRTRDEISARKRQETITKAEQSIDDFYNQYNAKKERNIKENKEIEAQYLAQLSESLSAGTTWSRICELIELQNSQSKTLARSGPGTTDLTRFREVLLRLKREGEAAPGAAGY